jgi:hypothetical protein
MGSGRGSEAGLSGELLFALEEDFADKMLISGGVKVFC